MESSPLKIGDLTVKLPIIQGGMGVGISLSGLAGAVAREGGVGIISTAQIGFMEPDWETNPVEANLRAIGIQIKKARELAMGGILGVNIMAATRYYEKYVKAAVDNGIDLIISGAGLPISLPGLTEGSKTKIAPIVSSEKSVSVICRMWERKYSRTPDLVVVEGPRAGGHLGFSLEQLENIEAVDYDEEIKRILAYIKDLGARAGKKIPVVIAGGVYEKADMDHYMELGADGVQIGTRFVTTEECDASMAYKQAYINAEEKDIQIVKSPVGMPGRGLKNPRIPEANKPDKCHQCIAKCNPKEIPYCITNALVRAAKGDIDKGMVFCGSSAYRAVKIETVKEVMDSFR